MKQSRYVPFQDPQAAVPVRHCAQCGREMYALDGICLYCLVHGT